MSTRRIPARGAALLLLLPLAAACRDHPTAPLPAEPSSSLSLAPAPPYSLIDLGTLAGRYSYATAINSAGEVVGHSGVLNDPNLYHAFLWTSAGGMQDLGTLSGLPGDDSHAYGINDSGTVVGEGGTLYNRRAFSRSRSGEWRDLGPGGARAINNQGEIVVQVGDYSRSAYLYRPGQGLVRLEPFSPFIGINGVRDINDSSQVVGDFSGLGGVGVFIIRYPGPMQVIAHGAGNNVEANAINNAGQVVGGWSVNYRYRAFVWDSAGGLRYLPLPPYSVTSHARAIDDAGRIVGSDDRGRTLLWTPDGNGGHTVAILGPRSVPHAMNAAGQVVGYAGLGYDNHAVLLSPGPAVLPVAPADVAAAPRAPRTIVVTWRDASNNEVSFSVQRGTLQDDGTFGPYETIGSPPLNSTARWDGNAEPGRTYRYRVGACNEAGCANAQAVAATMPLLPAAPAGLAAAASPGRVDLAWTDASTGETSFRVRRSTQAANGAFPPDQVVDSVAPGTTAWADRTVAMGITYRYRVEACVGTWNCSASDTVTVTTPLPPLPNPPGSLTATVVAERRVELTWVDRSTDEGWFAVRRALRGPDGAFAPYQTIATRGAGATSYTDAGGTAGATYRYQVQACSGVAWNCASSDPAEVTLSPPAPPGGVAARAVSGTRVEVGWSDPSSYETSFRVRRGARLPDGTFAALQTVGTVGAGVTAFADSTVAPGHTYRYVVQACYGAVCVGPEPVTVDVPRLPAAPAGLSARTVSGRRIDLAWTDAATNESAYLVRRTRRRPDGTYPPYQTIATLRAGSTAYADLAVEIGRVYHYRVAACNVTGCAFSDLPSSGVAVAWDPAAPTGVSARAVSATRVDVGWTDASGNETSFRVQRSTRRADGTFPPFQTVATRPAGSTTFTDNTVAGGSTYRYLVQACRSATCTPSASVPVTVPAS